jgi:NitT/TauT family transport system substrate-binding protein
MKLRVAAVRLLSMCPFYLAYEAGYFADAGFEVDVVKDLGTPQSLPLLAGGKLDAAFNGFGPSLVNAVAHGGRVRIVAGREILSSSCGTAGTLFVSRKAFPQGVRSMRQLKGARIGVNPGPGFMPFLLETLLRHEGMRLGDVVVRTMSEAERVAAVRSGAIDAYVSGENDMSAELGPLGLVAGPSAASILPNFQFSYICFGSRLLDGPVETGARFLHAYFRGTEDYLNGKSPRYLDEYAKRSNLDAKLLRQACRGTFERDGNIHLGDLRLRAEWMAGHDMCPANVDVATLADTRFLEAVRKMK